MTTKESDQKLVLINHWVSLFCIRVRVALAEKGITNYEIKEEDLINSTSKSPLLVEMNPVHKLIPVLIHDGKPICESLIIVEYIDQLCQGNSWLLPCDAYERNQAKFWAHFIDTKVHPPSLSLWRSKGETQEAAKKEFVESFKLLEQELGDKCYFGGDNFGFVDIALIPFYSWFSTYEMCANFSIEAECPKIVSWGRRSMKREAIQKQLPDAQKVSELILELRKIVLGMQEAQ